MHRWSPQCALGWLQAELEEAEQEAEVRVRGGWGQVNREGNESRLIGVFSEKPSFSEKPTELSGLCSGQQSLMS